MALTSSKQTRPGAAVPRFAVPGNSKPSDGADLRAALPAGRPATEPQHPGTGCSIKWK